jgi:RimJ/RimL family protein N-acetyltransferase
VARAREHWEAHGFGHWAAESRADGAFVGFAGIAFPAFLPELADRPELGWRLDRAVWGRGLATEAGLAARDWAFREAGMPELISIIHPDNAASRRVAEKVGMTLEARLELLEVWAVPAV